MKTLIVDHEDGELRYEAKHLLVFSAGKRIHNIPIEQVERLIVAPHIVIGAGVLGVVAEQSLSLLVVNLRLPNRTATLSGHSHGDVSRRLKQYQLSLNTEFCANYAQFLVAFKIQHQRQLLNKALQKRADLRLPLRKGINQLDEMLLCLQNNKQTCLQVICGVEGSAAACYFEVYKQLFASDLGFCARKRRPPPDPVNALLSLCYTLVHHEAEIALQIGGLDPMLGFFHQPYYGRNSLACDLVEPLRAYIEEWVWRWLAEQKLTTKHFVYHEGACFLNESGKRLFYRMYFHQVKPLRRLLRYYVYKLLKIILQTA